MSDHGGGLSGWLDRFGAPGVAAAIARGHVPSDAEFDRLRTELSSAAGAARAGGLQAPLAAEVRAVLVAGGPEAGVLAALLSGDRAQLPVEVATAPAPPVSPPPVAPVAPPEPFAVSRSTVVATGPSLPEAVDGYAWGAVVSSALSIVLALQLPLHQVIVAVPVVSLCVLGLLLVDRSQLAAAGKAVPGWGWALLPPAYLFRRGRALGQRPIQAYALVGIGMVTRVALVVFGVSVGGGAMGDLSALASVLEADYAASWQQPVTADCPRYVELATGTEFDCHVEAADGTSRTQLTFRVADDQGAVEQVHSSFSGTATGRGPSSAGVP